MRKTSTSGAAPPEARSRWKTFPCASSARAFGVSVSVSVAELFAGSGSVAPAAAAIDAVFTRLPVASGSTVPVKV